ncbi:MAG: MAPEG family protein [Pseudomonadota bacterium]
MTTELLCLLLIAVFAALMWVPFVIGVSGLPEDMQESADNFTRPVDLRRLPEWIHRAHRAQSNLIEQAVPFGMAVIVAHLINVSNAWTVGAAVLFVATRLVHAFGMISGLALFPVRPIIFSIGVICTLVIAGACFLA